MLSKVLFKNITKMSGQNKLLVFSSRHFSELLNWETD